MSATCIRGIAANPRVNQTPGRSTHAAGRRRLRIQASYRARLSADLAASAAAIERGTGKRPRTIVWPDAASNRVNEIAAATE